MSYLEALVAAFVIGLIVYLAGLALIWAVVIGILVFVLVAGYLNRRVP